MKILITGANGFVGKSLREYFSNNDQVKVIALGRKDLDLLDYENVSSVLNHENPDIIVHCAIKGGTRFDNDVQETFDQNLKMYHNLKSLRSKFKCLINIGSGAEFDRTNGVRRAKESLLFEKAPADFYGKVKNEISRDIVETQNFFNLRIFGCFGALENENRFLKIVFDKNSKSELIEINDNKEMDFVHVDDLAKAISFVSKNFNSSEIPKDINVVYNDKALLSEIVDMFIPHDDRKSEVRVYARSGLDYSGDSSTIDSLGILNFSPSSLKTSLQTYYNQLKIRRGSN